MCGVWGEAMHVCGVRGEAMHVCGVREETRHVCGMKGRPGMCVVCVSGGRHGGQGGMETVERWVLMI